MPYGAKQVFDNVTTEKGERERERERAKGALGGTSNTLTLLFEPTLKPRFTAPMFRQALCVLSTYVKNKKGKEKKCFEAEFLLKRRRCRRRCLHSRPLLVLAHLFENSLAVKFLSPLFRGSLSSPVRRTEHSQLQAFVVSTSSSSTNSSRP